MASTVGAIAEVIKVGLETVDQYVDEPARRLQARLELKRKALKKVEEIMQEDDPDESAKLSNELRDIVLGF
jgi:hypothetical protein